MVKPPNALNHKCLCATAFTQPTVCTNKNFLFHVCLTKWSHRFISISIHNSFVFIHNHLYSVRSQCTFSVCFKSILYSSHVFNITLHVAVIVYMQASSSCVVRNIEFYHSDTDSHSTHVTHYTQSHTLFM